MKKKKNSKAKKFKGKASHGPDLLYWIKMDWFGLLYDKSPVLKLVFEDCEEDWALFLLIDLFAEEVNVSFADATRWVLRQALGNRLEDARLMAFEGKPWDLDVQYVSRVAALQVCKGYSPDDIITLEMVDNMVGALLVSEEELLMQEPSINQLPC
ncbi:MAG: hypothetical protein WC029_01045 [Sulfuricella sp.]|jgi:hypothetical protein